MAYAADSTTLNKHRAKLLAIALRHAQQDGILSLNRARIAAEGGVSSGVVSMAFTNRKGMISAVEQEAELQGISLRYS
jgi:hypothetical protein